jgi:hypothetical protein
MRIAIATASLLVLLCTWWGCGDDGGETGEAQSTGTVEKTPWSDGTCGVCFAQNCASQRDACAGDPDCASYLTCLEACEAEPKDGPPDAACAGACQAPEGTAARAAYDNLDYCRTQGDGAKLCETCGFEPPQGQDCAPSTDPNPCYACEDENCCESYEAYAANPEAKAIYDCILTCTQPPYAPCQEQCVLDHPDGAADWGARLGCNTVHCSDTSTCGEVPLDACLTCVYGKCGDPYQACSADAECFRIMLCTAACPDECAGECAAEHPDAAELYNDFALCAKNECLDVCG